LKAKLYILGFLLCFSFSLFSQGEKEDKVNAIRVAVITSELKLTTEEAQKFWPVYNEYLDKQKAARREFKTHQGAFANDKEAQEYLEAELLLKQRELSLYKEYYDKFKKVLPLQKVAQLRQAEDEFKKVLLKKLQS
jgi:hypothetical protein